MKKILTISAVLFLFSSTIFAQAEAPKKPEKLTDAEIQEFDLYQFYLDKKVIEIKDVQYEKESLPIDGQLSEDGKRVILDGYTKRGRVSATVKYADGTTEKISRSSCVIDPVIPL